MCHGFIFVLVLLFLCFCRFSEEAELDDAVHTALLTMREGFEGEMTEKNIEVSIDRCFFLVFFPPDFLAHDKVPPRGPSLLACSKGYYPPPPPPS